MENKEIQNISLEDLFNNIKFISNEITIKYKCENDKIIITPIKNKKDFLEDLQTYLLKTNNELKNYNPIKYSIVFDED